MFNIPDASSMPAAQPEAAPKRGGWLKWLGVIVTILVVLRALVFVGDLFGVLGPAYGTKLEFKESELYYTDTVTEPEAQKLGAFLQEYGYFDDNAVSVQLHKAEDTYQVRFVVKADKAQDEGIAEAFKLIGTLIRDDVLNGATTEIHLCDDELETLRVLTL